MKVGVVLAGGTGSRLGALTAAVNKHLLPIYDKPLIHYPIATLMLAGIREIVVVTSETHIQQFQLALGDGSALGISIKFGIQTHPRGISDGLLSATEHIGGRGVALILGDNVFFGPGMGTSLADIPPDDRAHIFAQTVTDPRPYATLEFDIEGRPIDIVEKPARPLSNSVVPGLYWLPGDALAMVETLKPSERGELEITDLNLAYLNAGRLSVHQLPRGSFWIDAGTPESLLVASNFVHTIQQRQGLMVGLLEEIAWRQGWISTHEFRMLSRGKTWEQYADGIIRGHE